MLRDLVNGPGFAVGLVLGILIGWVLLWCFLNPWIGRMVVRTFAVVALGHGAMWIVTPISDAIAGNNNVRYHSPMGDGDFGVALGWGAEGLVVGVLALVFSFLGRRKRAEIREGTRPPVRVPDEGEPKEVTVAV